MISNPKQNYRQRLFSDMVLGILIYSVVLGFFEDYTNILSTWSYSITFLTAVVMQLLTYATFWLKSLIVKKFKGRGESKYKVALIFGVWFLMFSSKFVFLFVINSIFGDTVEISGFIGLVLIIITMTIARKLIEKAYQKLAFD